MSGEARERIFVLDFGGQYAHLICRRVRAGGVYAELVRHDISAEEIKALKPRGLILSGGPASVYDEKAPMFDKSILSLGIPILGICYGLQLIVQSLGGRVVKAERREYGRTELYIRDTSDLFQGLKDHVICWMSHSDIAEALPEGFEVIAYTKEAKIAAIRDRKRRIYGTQFHPEVVHTEEGQRILENFLSLICGCAESWRMSSFIEKSVEAIRRSVGGERVLCALSGGVDSSTTAALVHRAVGDQLTCLFVDHGLLRKGEAEHIVKIFKQTLGMNVVYVDAAERFLEHLKGVSDPEEKRRIIGEEFIQIFSDVGERFGPFKWLAQGTLYPDVIESASTTGPSSRIKTHHNVAGLPSDLSFKLIEPLKDLYKDEVREVAKLLGLPDEIVSRHPFPGPGLAVRIIGALTPEKLKICREASAIVEEELRKAGLQERVWQAFAIVGDDKAVGVLGDVRMYGYIVTVRVVESRDAMTADWVRLPYDLLERISSRITNEVPGVTWVSYAVSSKPPSTIEPQ